MSHGGSEQSVVTSGLPAAVPDVVITARVSLAPPLAAAPPSRYTLYRWRCIQ